MRSRLPFLLLAVLFFSVCSWSSCYSQRNGIVVNPPVTGACVYDQNWNDSYFFDLYESVCSSVYNTGNGYYYTSLAKNIISNATSDGCSYRWIRPKVSSCSYNVVCTTLCEADSVSYYQACLDSGGTWRNCECVSAPPAPDTTWHCQNSGGEESGGIGGSPRVSLLFRCVDGSCTQTARLSGWCQDWGFCPEGVTDCDVPCSGSSCPPCGRSGGSFTTSSRCYYQCADGKQLSCTPTSTQYVAGAIYAGSCPDSPPDNCRPRSSSSAASSGSSSPSSSPSSGGSSSPFVPPPTSATSSPSGDEDWEYDYSLVLQAIHDTLHAANVQRDFLIQINNSAKIDLDNISEYSTYNYNELHRINTATNSMNSTLSDLSQNGFSLVSETSQDISVARDLLDEINRYLRSDSLLSPRPSDTTYNPLLRDIKDALDSASFRPSVDTSIFARDSVFAKWWANYYSDSASSRGLVGKALNAITQNLSVADSSKKSDCGGFYSCMRVYKNMDYCSNAWGVGSSDCVESGTPFDGMWNVEAGILETVWNGIFGDDTTTLSTLPPDTNYTPSPAADSAKRSLLETVSALFSSDSTTAILNKVQAMKDSAEKRANDTTKIQPDSLWLDSAEAAHYVSNFLLPSGTGSDCFVCSANLGTFGGLAKQDLQIVIDFSNFGGFNWCALIRAVVKIATLVVCISLTLGSWAAAFGYNPKNDA